MKRFLVLLLSLHSLPYLAKLPDGSYDLRNQRLA